ncbi:amidohydrolase [Gynurincola endophyticus]|uniref:amidohydrolase n=1 Tax=Gynurincola endophyticus TaxID=2479004 RepID=UPI000F8E5AE3|nr:amidohydrolase [Gynurincola endophyticus]
MRKFHQGLLFALLLPAFGAAQKKTSIDQLIVSNANDILPQVIEWRRHLHQYPELSNREEKTAQYIAEKLRAMGIEVQTGIGKHGVVGILKGKNAGPVVALRADMDGLPVLERANLPYKSVEKGEYNGETVPVMHACGHDSHMAMLLGAAKVLTTLKDQLSGTVKFIFQPAEEGAPDGEEGGAPLMIKEGVMQNPKVDAIFGIHISAQLPIGTIAYKSGPFMAASDWFKIIVNGKQSHGSTPWTGVDPIVVGTTITNALQTIVSRQSDLTKAPVVITVGKFHSGVRSNIIPEQAILEGTIRTLDKNMQEEVHARIIKVSREVGEAMGARIDVSIDKKTALTYNDPALVERTLPSLEKAVGGKQNLVQSTWITGAEDFSFYGEHAPAFFFNVGGRPANVSLEASFPHHTPDFILDDSRLDVGVKAFVQIVFDYTNKK